MATYLSKNQADREYNRFPGVQARALKKLIGDPAETVGTPGTNVTAVETAFGPFRKTVLTLTAVAQAVVNGTEYQGSKIYDWPLGLISVVGATFSIAQTTTSILADTLNASSTGAIALGSATASNVSLTSTMANVCPTTAFTSSATINVAGTAVSPATSAPVTLQGSGTAADLYVNTGYATTGDVDADATQTLSGTVTIIWTVL
jgi:hypothetical protein